MSVGAIGGSLLALVAVVATVFACGTIWLLLTDPIATTQAVAEGAFAPLAADVGRLVMELLSKLARWL